MEIFKILVKYYAYMIFIFFLGRLLLFIEYFNNFKDSGVDYWLTFIYGLKMDTISASVLLLIPLIVLSFMPKNISRFTDKFLKYYFLIILSILIYIENATFTFLAQYDVRPNYLFVEYLIYPQEVFAMIFADYKLELLIFFVMIVFFIYLFLKYDKNDFSKVYEQSYLKRVLIFITLFMVLFIGARSSFGHRPANISDAMYTSNRMVNEITKNSVYSIAYAIYVSNKHGTNQIKKIYGDMNIKEAFLRVTKRLNINKSDQEVSLLRDEKTHFKSEKPKNLIIFVEESLGYQFVKAVGGEEGITPNFNRLSKEGILFKDLYSNGTRSIRGLAGLSAGNFSIPGKGVLKRNKSQRDYFTIASALKPLGYHTSFIYGGESRFDNMRSWYLGNGFDEILDESEFENPTFKSSWGVCDEDLVVRANKKFKKMYLENQKFASVMFSTSNHAPFECPYEKIDLVDKSNVKSVKNAVKYADYAIGKFIELAKKEDYYKDTVIVVVADHNVRVYGEDIIPIDMFHIPGLILGGDIKPMVYDKISTQPDILATALDLIGVDLSYPIMGQSIFSDKKNSVSLMQFYSYYALRVDDKVAVIRPNKEAVTFAYKDQHLSQTEHDLELEKDALAFILALDYMYDNKLYNNKKENIEKSAKI
ncbi:LTA synthase family protein [Sulfurimonas sp.]|uniref:LTA synthase family protein n=1 Tax=Sulfurimonas sp. TaxID=2022749 RepID=UPI003566ED03